MKALRLVGFFVAVGLFAWATAVPSKALSNREGPPGLYAEQSTVVDGVTVRRIRDSANGTVCYVASASASWSGTVGGAARFPAISCVGWQP